jgi:uncharacterized protein YdhG (YjbR/CyaY superfamily)
MANMKTAIKTVDEYISTFPADIQKILEKIRGIIKKQAPEAVESISYGMPGYKTNKRQLVYFAAYKNHIGFYATPTGHAKFAEELSTYQQGRGSVQFPLNKPIPYNLITRIVEFRVKENLHK